MDPFCNLCFTMVLLYCLVCSLQPCDHLLGKGGPLGSICVMFPCGFVTFPYGVSIRCVT